MHILGVISDTHGLLRPEAIAALAGCELIVHAGDVGGPDILPRLQRIAPVIAVRGNVDGGAWSHGLPERNSAAWAGNKIYVLHDLADLNLKSLPADVRIVVTGHSHLPMQRETDGVLYLNPGSAGPRRFGRPISLARVVQSGSGLEVEMRLLPG